MPKLKLSAQQKRGEIISAWQRHYDLPDDRAAQMIGVSTRTLQRRKKIGDWSIDELHKAIRAFHIPTNDALELLMLGCLPMMNYLEKERKKHGYQ